MYIRFHGTLSTLFTLSLLCLLHLTSLPHLHCPVYLRPALFLIRINIVASILLLPFYFNFYFKHDDVSLLPKILNVLYDIQFKVNLL